MDSLDPQFREWSGDVVGVGAKGRSRGGRGKKSSVRVANDELVMLMKRRGGVTSHTGWSLWRGIEVKKNSLGMGEGIRKRRIVVGTLERRISP